MRQRQYAALPVYDHEEDQLEQAFAGSDNEDDGNNARDIRPLLTPSVYGPRTGSRTPRTVNRVTEDGHYNFEYEYGPPPGSPPRDLAVPNHWGNTNGVLISQPINYDFNSQGNWFSRTWRSLLDRNHRETPGKRVGGGTDNDGVFANLSSRPIRTESSQANAPAASDGLDGDERNYAPEYATADVPPTYRAALADNAPPYWENTVLTTVGDDFLVDSIPTGSIYGFIGALLVSTFLEWIGFVIAFILSQTHGGRYGARAGLGITFIRFGFWFRTKGGVLDTKDGLTDDLWWPLPEANMTSSRWNYTRPYVFVNGTFEYANETVHFPRSLLHPNLHSNSTLHGYSDDSDLPFGDWLALFFMTLGWFIFMSSLFSFWRIKRWEHSIRASNASNPANAPSNNEEPQRPPVQQVFLNFQQRPLPDIPVGRTPTMTQWPPILVQHGRTGGVSGEQRPLSTQMDEATRHQDQVRQYVRGVGYL
ncbi:hypothetical protein FRC19_009035 [Serendipita sp. 401]|nr:hypothetical protein FRC19_009035 [Serendipita sp. 401]KAG8868093.1 hypothetical protein FRC20_004194 [Serendipita sp. 405]